MLSPGEAIITGELTPLTPLRIRVRPRYTVHGAPGYNILKELSEADLSKRATISERLKAKLQHIKESTNNPISQESAEEMDQITQLQKENIELKDKVVELEAQLKTPQAQLLLPTPPEQKIELEGESKKNEQEKGNSRMTNSSLKIKHFN